MTESVLFRVAFGLLGACLVYVAMCRFAPMSKSRTLARVRHAALGLFIAGLLMIGAVTIRPDLMQLAVLSGPASALGWFAATSHAWRRGQPLVAERGGQMLRRGGLRAVGGREARAGDDPPTVPMTDREMRRVRSRA